MFNKYKIIFWIIGLGVVAVLAFIMLYKSDRFNGSYKSDKPPVFSSSASPVISLGISVAEAASLPQGIALIESNIAIMGPRGERMNESVNLDLKPQDNGEYGLVVNPKNEQSFRPGKYSVSADIKTNKGIRHIEQDFLWGVLAINPNKSVYHPGEIAKIALAVLDEKGMMVCDATVALQVRKSESQNVTSLTTENGKIRVNEECRQKRVTERPDYETEYTAKDPGIYQMTLTATTKNGTYTIEDYFEVKESIPFDIERITATRIYPVHEYPVSITVTPEQDFSGIAEETVPEFFEIKVESPKSKVESNNKTKTIVWNVDWKAGETYELSYIYKSPEISPQFYLLGPLKFQDRTGTIIYQDERPWQIAVDAIAIGTTVSNSGGSNSSSLTVSNVTVSGSNRLLLVGISIVNDGAAGARLINSVTWNTSESMTLVSGCNANVSDDARVWIYKLVAPTATTANVVITLDGQIQSSIYAGATPFTGVDQTTPLGTCVIDEDNDATLTVTASSETGGVVFDTIACENCVTSAADGGQTEQWDLSASTDDRGAGSTESGAASVTMSWTLGVTSDNKSMVAVPVKAAAAASAPSISSVTDTPDPTNPGRSVTFSTSWTDSDSTTVKVKVCKSSTLSSQNCSDGSWASSTVFTSQTPENLVYDIVGGDAGTTRSYFVHSCDDGGTCTSTSTAGTFTVNIQSNVPNIKFR